MYKNSVQHRCHSNIEMLLSQRNRIVCVSNHLKSTIQYKRIKTYTRFPLKMIARVKFALKSLFLLFQFLSMSLSSQCFRIHVIHSESNQKWRWILMELCWIVRTTRKKWLNKDKGNETTRKILRIFFVYMTCSSRNLQSQNFRKGSFI